MAPPIPKPTSDPFTFHVLTLYHNITIYKEVTVLYEKEHTLVETKGALSPGILTSGRKLKSEAIKDILGNTSCNTSSSFCMFKQISLSEVNFI